MKFCENDDGFSIINENDFIPEHIFECGQVFRYAKNANTYEIYAMNHKATLYCDKKTTKIICDDKKFFNKYFDFNTDYDIIKLELSNNNIILNAIPYGYGIRILNQDPIEVIISFIISANNNIPRIKQILQKLCDSYGSNMGDYFAFPTLSQLSLITKEGFRELGCGYRDKYLVETINKLKNLDLDKLYKMQTCQARNILMTLTGVGRKVADCILLFGFSKYDVFPVDTWIKHLYKENFNGTENDIKKISEFFINTFGKYSGIAQQYLYYAKMKKNI